MDKLGVYIHIPFCVKKCNYCDFLSAPGTRQVQNDYMGQLLREMEEKKEVLMDYQTDTIFIGGGTPSIIESVWIEKILCKLNELAYITDNCEITMEMNPGTVTKESLAVYKKAGVNRVSLGLQSADNTLLKKLGRIHTYEEFLHSYKLVREAGFSNVNIDMMSALPGQTVEGYRQELEKVLMLSPEHLSAYSLIVEEETPFFTWKEQGKLELPAEDEEREMYYLTDELLGSAGYERYEISNYAKPGYSCRHNEGYWRRKDYIGFGIGAASLLKNVRYKNETNLNTYLEAGKTLGTAEVQPLSTEERMEEFMFLGLRMMAGVQEWDFFRQFGKTIDEVYGEVLKKMCRLELIKREAGFVKLTKKGIDISNAVMAEFLLE